MVRRPMEAGHGRVQLPCADLAVGSVACGGAGTEPGDSRAPARQPEDIVSGGGRAAGSACRVRALRSAPGHRSSRTSRRQRTAEVYKLITQELWRPFDLSRGPLVRASLLRVSATEHVLLLTIHHIIYDGWSRAVLLRELSTLYAGFVRGAPVSLPPLSFQYTDYAEREVKQTDVIARHLRSGKAAGRRSSGSRAAVRLPSARGRGHSWCSAHVVLGKIWRRPSSACET